MATSATDKAKAAAAPKKTEPATVYPADELIKAAKRFNTMPECVDAALRYFGKTEATLEETQKLVKDFLGKEVK